MSDPKAEYESLRDEILHWQSRRITIAGLGTAAFLAYLPWLASQTNQFDRDLASSLGLGLLAVLSLLTWVCGRSASVIGTYIEVFHEDEPPGWETRIHRFDRGFCLRVPRLNWVFGVAFLLLALITVVLARVYRLAAAGLGSRCLLGFAAVLFLLTWVLMTFFALPRDGDEKCWRAIKKMEMPAAKPERGAPP